MAENETTAVLEESTDVAPVESAPTETPKAEVPKEVKDALKKANKEAETLRLKLKEYEDRDKTEAQKLQEERDALLAERNSLALEQMRREVADEKGLTPAQARRLVGSTREELEADADEVIATFPIKAKPVFGDVGQGQRGESAQRVYTTSELNDFSFFQKHREDILRAYNEGRIVTE
jgi:FKBP-type peptidyl-prolyl cis-trans isomerase (trigger factor)